MKKQSYPMKKLIIGGEIRPVKVELKQKQFVME